MRDLYEVLGVERGASAVRSEEGVLPPRAAVPPGSQPGRQGRRGEVQGSGERVPDPVRRRAARALRSLRLRRHPRRRRRRRRAGSRTSRTSSRRSAICSATSSAVAERRPPPGARRRPARRSRADVRRGGVGHARRTSRSRATSPARRATARGAKPGSKPETCRTCQGKGQVVHAQGFFMVQTTCPHCRGAGKTIKDPCEDCRGRGTQARDRRRSTSRCPRASTTVRRCASPARARPSPGGATGHLYVVLHVQGDERFKRDGDDILTEMPVSFVKAALGGELEIYTLDDNCNGSATIELKPGTQPGDVIVRRGQGIPRVGEQRPRRSRRSSSRSRSRRS